MQSFTGKYSFFTWKFAYRVAVLVGRATMGKTYLLGTSINDVRRFSAIFDLPTMSDNFYPITFDIWELFWTPIPINSEIGRNLWTFPYPVVSSAANTASISIKLQLVEKF